MPKVAKPKSLKLKQFVKTYGDIFSIINDNTTNEQVLYCKCCESKVNCERKSQVVQHLNTNQHENKSKTFKSKQISNQKLFENNQKEFNKDLCEFMVCLNIPFYRLLKPAFHKLFEKYTKFRVPNPSTLWKYHLKDLYDSVIEK